MAGNGPLRAFQSILQLMDGWKRMASQQAQRQRPCHPAPFTERASVGCGVAHEDARHLRPATISSHPAAIHQLAMLWLDRTRCRAPFDGSDQQGETADFPILGWSARHPSIRLPPSSTVWRATPIFHRLWVCGSWVAVVGMRASPGRWSRRAPSHGFCWRRKCRPIVRTGG